MGPLFASDQPANSTSCYEEDEKICYERISRRGRTLTGIYQTEKYKPFIEITSAQEFADAWRTAPRYVFANLSRAAYLHEAEIISMVSHFGGEVEIFEDRGRFGYLAVWPDKAVLVFLGSNDPLDMLTICALISGLHYPFKQAVTFGEPRVLDQDGPNLGESTRHIGVVNGKDNVVTVPPKILGYRHHSERVEIRDIEFVSTEWPLSGINPGHAISNYAINLWRLQR